MLLKVNPASPATVYQQICEQVKYAVATGVLAPGDRLPTIRQVAAETRVNRNTIARAYGELEREGVIVSRPGRGSFVAETATALRKTERLRVLEEMLRKAFVEAFHLKISTEELREVFERLAEEVGASRDSATDVNQEGTES